MRNYLKHIFLLCLCITALSSLDSFADNRFGVDSLSYSVYLKAINNASDAKVQVTADSLYKVGAKKKDAKVQALALTMLYTSYYYCDKYDEMNKAIEDLKALRSKHPEINTIYFVSIHNYIQYLLYMDENGKAMLEASNMSALAEELDIPYGQMLAYRVMGLIYDYRLNYARAAECYQRALHYCSIVGSEGHTATVRLLLAQEQIRLNEFAQARAQIDSSASLIGSSATNTTLYNYMNAYLGDESKDTDTFWKYYDLIMADPIYESILDEDSRNEISVDYYLSKGDCQTAMEYANKITQEDMHFMTLASIYEAMGDYSKSNQYLEKYIAVSDSLNAAVQSDDISMVDLEITNSKLKSEASRMHSRIRTICFSFIAGLLAITVAFLIYSLRRTKKFNNNLKKKNDDLRKANDAVEDALVQAKNANEIKTRFLQNMSHEVRTPLNAVVGFSQLMALPDGFISEQEKNEYNQIITSNAQMLSMLVDDILCLSDVENGKYTMNIGTHSCNEIANLAMKTVEGRVPFGVNLYYTTDVDDSFTIKTDDRRAQQVLINFLTNACKHTDSGEIHVDLCTTVKPGFVSYSVTDTGTGVPPDKVKAIFERFVKLDSSKQGAGIGLNICKVIAERLGGDIFLDTTYTKGARFVLELPLESEVKD